MTTPKTENTKESFQALLDHGDIVECPGCGAYNAYAFQDTNMNANTGLRLTPSDGLMDGGEKYTDEELLTNWPDVYEISTCGWDTWICRSCGTPWIKADSPLNVPCYTHSED